MKELFINGNPPDLNLAREKYQVSIGGESQCEERFELAAFGAGSLLKAIDACENHLCRHGKCAPSADGQTYECKCKIGYSGPFCDQGILIF